MIKNLSLQLNESGKIKIGKKGTMITSAKGTEFRPPKKLDHFQLTTTEKDEAGDFIIDVELQNRIKESGAGLVDINGRLIGLPIRLLYDDTELNFPTQYVSYISGQLACSGDGEVSRKRIDDYSEDHPCPCPRVQPGYDGKDKCKPTGTLTCVIDEAGLFGQAHKFRTTSMNSIKGILGGIELIKTATNNRIAGLPLMLTMNSKQTVTPGGASTIYIVSICYRGNLADLKAEALRIMSDEQQYLLAMDGIEHAARAQGVAVINGIEDEKEFVEEFFPHAVVVDPEKVSEEPKQIEQTKPVEARTEQPEIQKKEIEPQEEPESTLPAAEPTGLYIRIYEQLIEATDLDKAMSFANRLQKSNLFYFMANFCQHIEVSPKALKPELLEIIKTFLAETLTSEAIPEASNPTDPGKTIDTGTTEPPPVESVIEDDGSEYVRSWDDSGPIQKEQLRRLVQLKVTLEKQGVLQPDKWVSNVNFFADAEGKNINAAVNLTKTQGDTFIAVLEKHLTPETVAA